jgi:hypothetical protein
LAERTNAEVEYGKSALQTFLARRAAEITVGQQTAAVNAAAKPVSTPAPVATPAPAPAPTK